MERRPDLYESIGRSYAVTRREDPRIAAAVLAALGHGRSVVNIGAGTGSYEPQDREVVAVEPSQEMIRQREGRTAQVVRARAEALPFPAARFDAAMAVLTVHHWTDLARGLGEMGRVSRRQVVLFFEPIETHRFWALDYFPEALDVPSERAAPGAADIGRWLVVDDVRVVPVPRDCRDGFGAAYWARPEAYLDPDVQNGMSWLALLPAGVRDRGAARLAADLASGAWDERHGHLRRQDAHDCGYRIAVASGPREEA